MVWFLTSYSFLKADVPDKSEWKVIESKKC